MNRQAPERVLLRILFRLLWSPELVLLVLPVLPVLWPELSQELFPALWLPELWLPVWN